MAIETYRFADDGQIPNSALPLLVYRQALTGDGLAGAFERRFAANDWRGAWRNGIYDFHHFHSTSHEVLGIAAGEALVRFGGTHGQSVAVVAGDVVAIPAGVGHCLERGSRDLLVVGAPLPDSAIEPPRAAIPLPAIAVLLFAIGASVAAFRMATPRRESDRGR